MRTARIGFPFVLAALLSAPISFALAEVSDLSPQQDSSEIKTMGKDFYRAKAEGWFFYDDPVQAAPKKKEPPTVVKAEPKADEAPKEVAPAGPTPLSVAWIRENLPKFRDRAIDTAKEEDVRAYYYLQRVMMDKSQMFAEKAGEVVRKDPYLDEDTRRPVGTFAANAMTTHAGEVRSVTLKEVAKRAGFYFFFDSNCKLCAVQANVVEMLSTKTGFAVIPVSLDGKPMSGTDKYTNFRKDAGQAAALGITQTPALALGVPSTGDIKIVSYGVVALDVLENRVLLAARDGGLLTPAQYENTRPLQNNGLLAGDALEGVDAEQANQDPSQFIEMLKQRIATRGASQ